MNKTKFLCMTFFITCFTIFQLSAGGNMLISANPKMSYGNQSYGKETIDEIQANGFIKLDGTKITGYLQVNGHLKAVDAQIEEMQINGRVTLDNCVINQKSNVSGALEATNSKFVEELSISSERVIIDSCSLRSLRISQVGGYHGVQVVEIRGTTKIHGSIIFEESNGEVIVDPDSEIIGSVIGGKIRK